MNRAPTACAEKSKDQRPLIIDQPEENLDPNSVFEELVPHFREARHRRQVIVVTHNANLVVNEDADQVLVASSVRVEEFGEREGIDSLFLLLVLGARIRRDVDSEHA